MALEKSEWPHEDNKHYRGHLDRIYVSITEEWEIGYFVDKYLRDNGAATSSTNRDFVMEKISTYTARKPILRTDLVSFLNEKITFTKK